MRNGIQSAAPLVEIACFRSTKFNMELYKAYRLEGKRHMSGLMWAMVDESDRPDLLVHTHFGFSATEN